MCARDTHYRHAMEPTGDSSDDERDNEDTYRRDLGLRFQNRKTSWNVVFFLVVGLQRSILNGSIARPNRYD